MKIEIRDISTIRPYEKNPRLNDKAVAAVASLTEFRFRQPIVVDADGVIIAGHTRWKAAQKLGLAKVPVHVATDLSPEQVRAYRIADNKSGEIAEWNMEILPIELSELKATGFDMGARGRSWRFRLFCRLDGNAFFHFLRLTFFAWSTATSRI